MELAPPQGVQVPDKVSAVHLALCEKAAGDQFVVYQRAGKRDIGILPAFAAAEPAEQDGKAEGKNKFLHHRPFLGWFILVESVVPLLHG